jgi:hypothetical protein
VAIWWSNTVLEVTTCSDPSGDGRNGFPSLKLG